MLILALLLACDTGKVITDDTGTTGGSDGGATDGGTDGGLADGDGDGWVEGDCDDQDDSVYPGADEIPWDEIDQDCDGDDAGSIAAADGQGGLVIPDLGSVESTAEIAACSRVYGTTVTVDISHSYIADLIVSLRTPEGTAHALHVRSGGDQKDLVGSYSSEWGASLDAATDLAKLDGAVGTGVWTLVVHDQEGDDTGTLNSWSLELRCP